jgi:hypothetical protein
MNKTYRRRRQDQLPQRHWHTNRRHEPSQNIAEQHYLNKRSKMHHARRKRILPQHPNGMIQVHAPETL